MDNEIGFRTRFRFHLLKPLNIKEEKYRFGAAGRDIDLSPRTPGTPICESQWLVANCRGFDSEAEARSFATKLKAAVAISSVATRLGVNVGSDQATSRFSQSIKKKALEERGHIYRDDIHGIDVFLDDPNLRFPFVSGTGTVRAAPDPFLSDIDDLLETADKASKTTTDVVLLLNYALMRPEPVAQIVFAFSAVEMLGQQERWSASQREILNELAERALKSEVGTEEERLEVADGIRRGTQKIGLRQGVMRLLDSLQLGQLRKGWDELYSERSTLIHGLAPEPGARYDELASRTISLCGQILLKVIAKDVPMADRHVDLYYAL
ncbi:MAG: hypothetical protein ACFCUT_12085 [Kiloniellaceae bacterium]